MRSSIVRSVRCRKCGCGTVRLHDRATHCTLLPLCVRYAVVVVVVVVVVGAVVAAVRYLPSSTPSYVLSSFLKHIQPRALRGSGKEYVTAFAKYYFSRRPALAHSDIRLLLLGDDDRKGLVESCGNVKGLSATLSAQGGGGEKLRSSALLCVELLLMLLDANVNSQHADHFLDVLVAAHSSGQLSARLLSSMRLSLHIERAAAAGNATQLEYVYKLLFILESAIPALKGKEWVGSAEAVGKYEQWQRARLAEMAEQRAVADVEDEDRVLSSWSEVKLADLEAEEGQAEAALAELIADVDAEAEAEGGQKDPLGILQKPIVGSSAGKQKQQAAGPHSDIRTPARLGAAAAAQMKALWHHVSNNSGAQQKPDKGGQPQDGHGSGSGANAGGELLRDVLSAAHLASGGSISADSHNFNPIMFLSQAHAQTSLDQLQRGLTHLQRSVNNRAAALKSLVADHYGQYVYCLDTIEHLEQLMAAEVSDKGSSRAQRLRQQLDALNRQCSEAYDSVIARKAGGERMRQTLATMTQYRFLFALPGEVAQYANTRQFAQVVRAYKKAKGISITAQTAAATQEEARRDNGNIKPGKAVVQQQQQAGELSSLVLAEVFRVISGVRSTLFRQLETSGVPLDEQADAIAHLRDLDADIDPLWYFLHRQTVNTNQLMRQTVLAFLDKLHTARAQETQQAHSDGRVDRPEQQQPQQQYQSGDLDLSPSMPLPLIVDGSLPSHSSSFLASLVSSLPWNRFGSALLVNPVFSSSLPYPAQYASEWAPLLPDSVHLSPSVDELSAALLPSLVNRLCEILSHGVPNILTLARLTTNKPLSTLSMPAASPSAPSSSASSAQPGSSAASVLSSMDDSSRRGIENLLHSVFDHFAAYVRLALFPLSPSSARRWLSARADAASPPSTPSGGRQPSVIPGLPNAAFSLSSTNSNTLRHSSPAAQSALATPAVIDKGSEHQPFSMESMHETRTALPVIQPAETDSKLPLPHSLASIVRQLLQLHSQLSDTALPGTILASFTELRKELVRSYAQQHVRNVQTDVRALTDAEDWQLTSPTRTQQTQQARSAITRRERRGSNRRPRSSAAEPSSDSATDCSSLRITGLPGRFSAVFESTVDSLTAIPSYKPVWLIKLVAGPMMDAMRAFATAEQAMANQCAQQQSDGQHSDRVPAALRLLLVLANVRYTRLQLLPPLLASLLALFPHTTHSLLRTAYQQSVLPAYEEAETAALHHFIRLQLAHMHHHIALRAYSQHSLVEHTNAHSTRGSSRTASPLPPLRTRGCIVAACLHLVAVHAQLFLVCGHAADEVTKRAMQAMLTGTLHSIAIALQQLQRQRKDDGEDREGSHHDSSARPAIWSQHTQLLPLIALEVSFIHTVLSSFGTDESAAAKQHLEGLLAAWQQRDPAAQQQHADTSKQLNADIARTQLMFAAFQGGQHSQQQQQQRAQHNGHTHNKANNSSRATKRSPSHKKHSGREQDEKEREEAGEDDEEDDVLLDDDDEEGSD